MSEIINYTHQGLVLILTLYNYANFSYYFDRSLYDAVLILFYWLLEILGINILFIIIHNFFHKITIIDNIIFLTYIVILLLLVVGFHVIALKSDD